MARWILIDQNSGYIWGDSADLNGAIFSGSPLEYAKALDNSIGEHGRNYEQLSFAAGRNGYSGYYCYRADINGSEAVAIVEDGQNQETIDAVERDCDPVCFIRYYQEQP